MTVRKARGLLNQLGLRLHIRGEGLIILNGEGSVLADLAGYGMQEALRCAFRSGWRPANDNRNEGIGS